MVLLGIIVAFVSLFFRWFSVDGTDISGRAFSGLSGGIGYMSLIIFGILLFSLFSSRTKVEFKNRSGVPFSDYSIAIFLGLCLIFIDLTLFQTLSSLSVFSKDVVIGNGPSLFFVGALFIFTGGILGYREYKKELLETYIENSRVTSEMLEEYDNILAKTDPDKKNMSLPV